MNEREGPSKAWFLPLCGTISHRRPLASSCLNSKAVESSAEEDTAVSELRGRVVASTEERLTQIPGRAPNDQSAKRAELATPAGES